MIKFFLILTATVFLSSSAFAQYSNSYHPDFRDPPDIPGMQLVWHDEFDGERKPDTADWRYEKGLVRNHELQYYQTDNAFCSGGRLIIEAKREKTINPNYKADSKDWRAAEFAAYTSSSIQTRGKHQWLFGRFEIRARIDTSKGSWPAIWTLGVTGSWPANGEIDIMEFYRNEKEEPIILANFAWLSNKDQRPEWVNYKKTINYWIQKDPDWVKKFHVWRMDWNKENISILLDDELLNTVAIKNTVNPDGENPYLQPHYLLLNLAIGGNGKDPSQSEFPIKYEVDYVRVYQDITKN